MRTLVAILVGLTLSYLILGPFALPAAIGVLIALAVAVRNGYGYEPTMRVVIPLGLMLLIAGFGLAMLLVPATRIVHGSANADTMGRGIRVVAPATTLSP